MELVYIYAGGVLGSVFLSFSAIFASGNASLREFVAAIFMSVTWPSYPLQAIIVRTSK